MGSRNGIHKVLKPVKRQAPASLPPSVIYVDVSVLLHAIHYKHPELAEMIATYTPSSPNLDQLVKKYAKLITAISPYTSGQNVEYVFEGEAHKPSTPDRLRKLASKRNFAYRNAILTPKSKTSMAAAVKKLASCMGRPPAWFIQMVVDVMKGLGLTVRNFF